jgi:aminopeptidase
VAEPLVIELFRAVVAAGGNPLVRMNPDETGEIMLKHGTDEQLKYVNPVTAHEYELIDCSIGIWGELNTRAMTNVDPKRMGLSSMARKPLMTTFMKRAAEGKLKWCGTQYPCHAAAQDAEMSLTEYADLVFGAGLIDHPDPVASWKQVSARQQKLVDFLQGKSDYRVTAANGTDVRMSVAGRTWVNCDGHENFPDGEVFTGPVLDSVNGVVHYSFPAVHGGREVQDVVLKFRDGKVVDASASKGQDYLIGMLDMDAGARFLGECAIGTNFGIKRYTRNTLFDEKIGGTVHFAVGAGYPETGNTNESGLHWDMVVDLREGGKLEIDGEVFNVDGKFVKEGFPNPV